MKLKKSRYLRRKDYIMAVSVFIAVCCVLCGLFLRMEYKSVQESRVSYQYFAANQSNIICSGVNSAISRVYTLKAMIIDNDGDTSFFDEQAEDIFDIANADSNMCLRDISLAPGGVIDKFYPVEGNENLSDFDLLDVTGAGNQEAVKAYESTGLVVSQPFELVTGGTGMAGRLPVFLGSGVDTDFWGLVSVTLDFNKLLDVFNLDYLKDIGLNYELWYEDRDGKKISLVSTEEYPEDAVSYSFNLHNITWSLDVSPESGWVNYPGLILEFIVGVLISAMLSLLFLEKIKLNRANTTLEQLANLDSLTLCLSRHYVNIVLINQRTGKWNDPNARYSLAVFDIDNFKNINDTYGHDTGDKAIVAVAHVLKSAAKSANGDCVIRFGGDEFIVLFNDVTLERFTDKLSSILQDVQNIHLDSHPDLHLSVSCGGEFNPGDGTSQYYEMVQRADAKLYLAKQRGRNQFCIACDNKYTEEFIDKFEDKYRNLHMNKSDEEYIRDNINQKL